VSTPDEEALYVRKLPFRTFDYPGEVHPGLRAYPFLAQVCRHPRCCGCGGLILPAGVPFMHSLAWACAAQDCTEIYCPVMIPSSDFAPCLPLQVCRYWKTVLEGPAALQALWGELVVDFGHELITGGGGGGCCWSRSVRAVAVPCLGSKCAEHKGAALPRRCLPG
jgi:hypothetical protein